MGLGLKTDEGGKEGNGSKIIKWILRIINSDNWFYYFGKLLSQSTTKYLTQYKFQNKIFRQITPSNIFNQWSGANLVFRCFEFGKISFIYFLGTVF